MTTSIHRLTLASVALAGEFNPPNFQDTHINVFAYLVDTPIAKILVDTGVGRGNKYIEAQFGPQHTPISEELVRLGYTISDIDIVINSHLHFDHCGNNALFPNADIYVQQAELDIARSSRYTVREWFDYPGAHIVSVAGDMRISEHIELVATPGHTPGHQSVLVHGPEGRALIAAQAAFSGEEFARGGDPGIQAHEGLDAQYLASIKKLRALAPRAIYFSHDPITQSAIQGVS